MKLGMRIDAIILILLLAVIILPQNAPARGTSIPLTEARDIFSAGNAFYREQQYNEARVAYRELLDAGYDTAAVLYNLGTTNARLGSSTVALANLTRARRLSPRNPDIRANLAYVKAARPKPLPGEMNQDASTAESTWARIYGWFTAEEWLMLVWISAMLLAAGVSIALITRSARWEAAGRGVAIVGIVAVGILVAPTAAQVYASKIKRMAMVIESTDMLSGPAPRFTRVNMLQEGATLRLLGHESDGYVRVQLPDGVTGYVQRSALARI